MLNSKGIRRSLPIVVISSILFLAVGCSNTTYPENDEPVGTTVTPVSTPEPQPTFTPEPSQTPTSTYTPKPTIFLSPTVSPTYLPQVAAEPLPQAILDKFLFTDQSCQLPCWNGLVVGESGIAEIQEVFDRVFEFNGSRDFFPEPLADTLPQIPDGYYVTGPNWPFEDENGSRAGIFIVAASIDDDNLLLRDLYIRWGMSEIFQFSITPQQIIRELGRPDHMRVRAYQTEKSDIASWQAVMIYDIGIVISYNQTVEISTLELEGGTIHVIEICLSDNIDSGQLSIMEPLENGFDDLSPIQQFSVGDVEDYYPKTMQEFFDMSLEEITTLAIEDEDACLSSYPQ